MPPFTLFRFAGNICSSESAETEISPLVSIFPLLEHALTYARSFVLWFSFFDEGGNPFLGITMMQTFDKMPFFRLQMLRQGVVLRFMHERFDTFNCIWRQGAELFGPSQSRVK